MIDFTNCKRILNKGYSGANGKKIAIEYQSEQYMLKFPPSGNSKPTELSYTNSCYSEHIGSSIFNIIGIEAQKTMLGTFVVNGKRKIVCACLDFTTNGKQLYDFCAIKNTVIDSEHGGTGTDIEDIMDTISQQTFINPLLLSTHFWNMFVIDALLGNFDRHNGNWGFLVDLNSQETRLAPIYDCGSCLLPQADEKIMKEVLTKEYELNARIYNFPNSSIKQNGKKINYYDFITSCCNEECNKAILRIVPKIDMNEIFSFINSIDELSELQRNFYKKYIESRYNKILLSAYKKLTDIN